MEKRNYIFSFDEEKCTVGKQKGTLKTFKIEEELDNGQKVCVHTDIHFKSKELSPTQMKLMKLLKRVHKSQNRRVA